MFVAFGQRLKASARSHDRNRIHYFRVHYVFAVSKITENEGFVGSFLTPHSDRIRFHKRRFYFHGFARKSMKDRIERISEIQLSGNGVADRAITNLTLECCLDFCRRANRRQRNVNELARRVHVQDVRSISHRCAFQFCGRFP